MSSRTSDGEPVRLLLRHGLRLAGLLMAAAAAFPVHGQVYDMVDLATLSEGTTLVVRGPNVAGTAVGGGRLVQGGRMRAAREGLLFQPGTSQIVQGLEQSDFTTVFGLNDLGDLVGSANGATAVRAFAVARDGSVAELPPLPGDSASMAFAISNSGQVVGYSSGSGGERAVSWLGGTATVLPAPASTSSRAVSVNARGDVAGFIATPQGRRPVLWHGGAPAQELPLLPGYAAGEATHVNARGDTVGACLHANGGRRATFWPAEGGQPVELATLPGHTLSQALGSNDAGQVVGFSSGHHEMRAVLWSRAAGLQDLNTLVPPSRVMLTRAVGINNAGMIIALGSDRQASDGHTEHVHEHEHELPVRVFLLTRRGG
ncbi:hypothetical protein [Ramlibacter rhizophilus]|nr:hypothetical protein [Ramlibacter rhizophilus]